MAKSEIVFINASFSSPNPLRVFQLSLEGAKLKLRAITKLNVSGKLVSTNILEFVIWTN